MLRLLVEAGADVNRRDEGRRTPAMRAVAAGASAAALSALVQGRADLTAEDDLNRGALFLAASNPLISADALTLLVADGEVDVRESRLMTPLMEACRSDNLPAASALLDLGASLAARDKNGWTPLMFAAVSASPATIRFLAERGASLRDETPQGDTPLTVALGAGARPEAVEALLSLGADPNHRNLQDLTPLMIAVAGGGDGARQVGEAERAAVLKALLKGGADPDLTTWDRFRKTSYTFRSCFWSSTFWSCNNNTLRYFWKC